MKKVLADLRDQHQFILQRLEDPEKLSELFHFLEEVHHPLEEKTLFPFLNQTPWLCHGGPRCSFHMGMRLDQNPLARFEKHLADYAQFSGWTPVAEEAPVWLTPQNPLSVPMEEHAVSHMLASALKELMKDRQSPLSRKFFPVLYEDFRQLMKMHIDKEDHCLFVMCEQNLRGE